MKTLKDEEVLTANQFDAQWTSLLDQEKASETTLRATWDQKKAVFLSASGWTQEQIAEKVGKTQPWVTYYLRFGRFLEATITTGYNQTEIPPSLTERTFRKAWAACKGPSEESRFTQIPEWLEDNLVGRVMLRATVGGVSAKKIKDTCADGKWRTATQVARKTGLTEEDAEDRLGLFVKRGSFKTYAETREKNGETEYKIRKGSGKKVQLDVILAEIEPLLKELEHEGNKGHLAEYSPSTILIVTFKIRKLLKDRST